MTKTVGLVTGAGSGMGLACATRMADMVDVLFLADLNDGAVTDAAQQLSDGNRRATIDVFAVDITDESALAELSSILSEAGTLRAVVHAAGISPTMADWRKIFQVDLIGTARLTEMLFPLSVAGTSIVCYASMAPLLSQDPVDGAIDAVLDDPLQLHFLDRIHTAVGSSVEDSGLAYFWAKRGVHRLAQRGINSIRSTGGSSVLSLTGHHRHANGKARIRRSYDQRPARWGNPASPAGPSRGGGGRHHLPAVRRGELCQRDRRPRRWRNRGRSESGSF